MSKKLQNEDLQTSLFGGNAVGQPLAMRMRPCLMEGIFGQSHFLGEGFRKMITSDQWVGLIFWGGPGTGKTTLASVIAKMTQRTFHTLSAVLNGVKEFRAVLSLSRQDVDSGRLAHILFIDELHRLNKGQQDVLLPFLEDGSIRFIGATTENPSFEVNNAVISRCLVFHFKPLDEAALGALLTRVSKDALGIEIEEEVIQSLARAADGDARRALTFLEHLLIGRKEYGPIRKEDLETLKQSQSLYYDKSEAHYNTISAFIKSVRGSDPDAAIYYLARMLEGGEDPLFIARRLVVLASEDIGNANPNCLLLATAALQAVHAIGLPEGRIILAQVTTYLACSEKSNRSYLAIETAREAVKRTGQIEIPYSIRNAPTASMKEWGYGQGYEYAHNHAKAWVPMDFLPDELKEERFYRPSDRGTEKKFIEFLRERGKE